MADIVIPEYVIMELTSEPVVPQLKGRQAVASVEERLQALEQDNAALKQKIELHTLAIGGLANKAMLESISEKNDKIFKAIEDHGRFTNAQIAELREKLEDDIEGKVVGIQTETRQGFAQIETRFAQVEAVQHEHTMALAEQKSLLNEHTVALAEQKSLLNEHTVALAEQKSLLNEHTMTLTQVETTQQEHTTRLDRMEGMLTKILDRLPEKP